MGLANLVNIFDPAAIVLGGGAALDWGLFAGSGPGRDETSGYEGSGEEDRDSSGQAGWTFRPVGLSGLAEQKEWIKAVGLRSKMVLKPQMNADER